MRMKTLPFALVLAALTLATALTGGCQGDGVFGTRATTTRPAAETAADRRSADRRSADPKPAGDPADDDAAQKEKEPTQTLYERIGGEKVIAAIVDDLVARTADDPAINFTRKGTPNEWQATPQNVARLKERLVQFLGTATGGPQRYEGEDMRTAHKGMRIGDREFDAFAEAFKASLEHAKVPANEQKELLDIIESTRGPIVEERGTTRPSR